MTKIAVGSYIISRGRDSGVHAGVLESIDGSVVVLSDARRLWSWRAAGHTHTLSGVATNGLAKGSQIPPSVKVVRITDSCEQILCSQKAEQSIREFPVHRGEYS